MVYIIECKTMQATAVKVVADTLNSLLRDINLTFTPFYVEKTVDSESEDDSGSDKEENEESDLEDNTIEKKVGGVIIKEVNKTSSILVYAKLNADKFDHYVYNYKKSKFTIGVNLANFLKCLKCMTSLDAMSWMVDDEDINKLVITLESNERNEKKTFRLNLMDVEEEDLEIEPVQFPYMCSLPSQDFHKYCKDMAQAASKIEIKCTQTKLYFSGKGESIYSDFECGEHVGGLQIAVNTDKEEIVQGLFELKYLIIFTKCTNLCNQVTLYIKNDYPLIIQYAVAALGEIKLVLSPCKPDTYD